MDSTGGGGLEGFLISTFLIAYQALIFAIVISLVSMYIQWKFFVWVMSSKREDETEWYRFKKSLGLIKHERAGKSARLVDLIGIDEAKQEITEILDFLRNPDKYRAIGAQIPRGVLLVGQPGTGKTMLAQAIANEAGVPFFSADGGTLDEVFVGIGALRVRSLFKKARKAANKNPLGTAIIFIDEIDALGSRARSSVSIMGGIGNMTLNRLLIEMDGLPATSNVIVMAASNYDEYIDPAMLRPGRMDRKIYVPMPNMDARKKLFATYVPKIRTREPIDVDKICEMTVNFSPAEIAGVINEAALIAIRRRRLEATQADLEEAVYKISDAAADRRSIGGSMVMSRAGDLEVRFKDIIGMEDAKRDAMQMVEMLKNIDMIKQTGAHMPRGMLLVGPPGTGKTMLAKAIANEAGVPFYSVSGSDFTEIYRGMGASRVRSVYAQARKHKQSIVFIDEIDALGGARGGFASMSSEEHNQTLNQFLVELDGFGRSNVITIGATNFDDNLDAALLRPGRFDRRIYVPLPDGVTRRLLFQFYVQKIKQRGLFDWEQLVRATTNFSAADIMNIVNESSLLAVQDERIEATQSDLEQAVDQASSMITQRMVGNNMVGGRVTDVNVRFEDVIGVDEAKAEAREIVEMIKSSDRIKTIGARIPRGLLFVGDPGTGKTMLAKAIANEAGIPFYSVSGSDFVEVWVGLGASRVRSVYAQARRHKHAIVFIDEIDGLGGVRGGGTSGGDREFSNTLNQFLVELDGFGKSNVITIGATNFAERLDPALLRPGRFDRIIRFPLPSLDGRIGIIRSYLRKVQIDDSVNVTAIARSTITFSGADLSNLVNEAAILALREHRETVAQRDLIRAIEKVSIGIEHRLTMTPEEKRLVAYHEAGHTLVAFMLDRRHLVNKVSILPMSTGSYGHTWSVPTEEFHLTNEQEYRTRIMVSLGGYAAEKIIFGYNSDGVSGDFQHIGKLVRHMVLDMGMGGFLFNTNPANLSNSFNHNSDALLSEGTKLQIDEAMRRIAEDCYQKVDALLQAERGKLDLIAEALLKSEVLYNEDIVTLLGERPEELPAA